MRCHWDLDEAALPVHDRATFRSIATVAASPMTQVTLDSRSGVSRLALQSVYYVKTFNSRGSRIKHWLGISRYQRELRNLRYFNQLGLDTPRLIAHGHESRYGLLHRALLVTAEVPRAKDLEKILREKTLYTNGVSGARQILALLARATRLMHRSGFYHKDLKPRNILVGSDGDAPQLYFFDCPSGHHPPRFLLRRCIVRDLAHLEEGLRGYVRPVDMLYLYRQYRGCDKLSAQDKALLRDALAYHAQRRMTRKRRLREERKRSDD